MKDFRTITVIWKEAYGDTPVEIREENFDPERHVLVSGATPTAELPKVETEEKPEKRSIWRR